MIVPIMRCLSWQNVPTGINQTTDTLTKRIKFSSVINWHLADN